VTQLTMRNIAKMTNKMKRTAKRPLRGEDRRNRPHKLLPEPGLRGMAGEECIYSDLALVLLVVTCELFKGHAGPGVERRREKEGGGKRCDKVREWSH